MSSKKRRGGRELRPDTTTGHKYTRVRDPRAAVRFSLDEQVEWDEGDRILRGKVVGFVENDCMCKVLHDDGGITLWPTMSPLMRRVPKSDDELSQFTQSDIGRDNTLPAQKGIGNMSQVITMEAEPEDANSISGIGYPTVPPAGEYDPDVSFDEEEHTIPEDGWKGSTKKGF